MSALRLKNLERAHRLRQAEANDAFDYRWGDEEKHRERCLFGQRGDAVCARIYDPYPEGAESAPHDPSMYEGTGIGYLYNEEHTERFAWEFAGWTLQREGSI